MATWTTERARAAAYARAGNQAGADAARQRLKALKAEEYIRELVESAPPLSDDQRSRLAVLLRGSSERGAAA